MSEFLSLKEIATYNNTKAEYIDYVSRCIDDRRLPLKYSEWLEEVDDFEILLLS